MVSLKLKSGTKVEVENGFVSCSGNIVSLYEIIKPEKGSVLVFGYCLAPGEDVRRVAEGEYVISF